MQILGMTMWVFILMVIVSILVSGLTMWLGAGWAGVKKVTYGKGLWVAIVVGIFTWLVSAVFAGATGGWMAIIGFIVGVLISLWIIKAMFKIEFGQAFLVWIMNIVAQVFVYFIISIILVGTTFAFWV